MLQGIKTEIGKIGCFGMTEDAEDAAFIVELVKHAILPSLSRLDPEFKNRAKQQKTAPPR
jgi:hypothetical protein